MHLDWLIVGGGIFWLLWATYMKTYRTDTWLKLQDAGDRRRARMLRSLAQVGLDLWRRLVGSPTSDER